MRAVTVCLLLFFVGIASAYDGSNASASSSDGWSHATPVVARMYPLLHQPSDDCPTYNQDLFVKKLGKVKSVCVYGDERMTIGTYYDESGIRRAVVVFPYGVETHLLEGVCAGVRCRYSAATDTLVTEQYPNQYGQSLVVYKGASKRIKERVSSNGLRSYVFDDSMSDYEAKNQSAAYVTTPSFGISDNGQWAVMELKNRGVAVVNTSDFSVRQVTFEGYTYGSGRDPFEELSISDDGLTVVIAGVNAGLSVVDVRDDCGQPLVDNLSLLDSTKRCALKNLTYLFPGFQYAKKPRIFSQGTQVEVMVTTLSGTNIATIATDGSSLAHRLKILSIGDSFSSGEGETDDAFYLPGTNQSPDTCHVSRRAYAGVFALSIGVHTNEAQNVACSGAKIGDITGAADEYWGQGKRLGLVSNDARRVIQQRALDDFAPGRAQQIDFIDRYRPEVLTIGIGGNDAGLMGKLRVCAMPGTCEWAVGTGFSETSLEIERLDGKLAALFSKISALTVDSRVFVVGYPNIIDPDGPCDAITGLLFDHDERLFVMQSISRLNRVIRGASNKAGFTFVDIEDSFHGQNLCSAQPTTTMNALRFGDDIPLIGAIPILKVIGAETFHPTPFGHRLVADTLIKAYNGDTLREADHAVPLLGESRRQAFATDFATPDHEVAGMNIDLPGGILQPGSAVQIEVRSEPRHLAALVVDDSGNLEGSFTLPSDLVDGFHTLHLYGTNKEGNEVDLYQFVTIGVGGDLMWSPQIAANTLPVSGGLDIEGSETRVSAVLGSMITSPVASSPQQQIGQAGDRSSFRLDILGVAVVIIGCLVTIRSFVVRRKWAKSGS